MALDPAAATLRAQLAEFTEQFGHRETSTLMLLKDPTWGDSPGTVLGLVRVMLSRTEPSAPPGQSARTYSLERLVREPRVRRFHAQRWLRSLIERASDGVALREDTHFEITRAMPVVRRAVLEIGDRLAAHGWIDAPGDIWYLLWDEVAALPDPVEGARGDRLREAVARRRRAYTALASSPLIATATLYPGRPATGNAR